MIGDERISAQTVLWAAGVAASPVAKSLGVPLDRAGRVVAEPTLAVPGHPEIFLAGDICALEQDGRPLPGVAQVAMQEGTHAAGNVLRAIRGEPLKPFRYRDYGNMAVIGRGSAVADIGPVKTSGFLADAADGSRRVPARTRTTDNTRGSSCRRRGARRNSRRRHRTVLTAAHGRTD